MATGADEVITPRRRFASPVVADVAPAVGPAIALLVLQLVVFPVPLGLWVRGLEVGLLTALVAVGMALVYRANRVLNIAQGDLGFVPASLAVMLIVASGLHYLVGLVAGLAAAVVLGVVVEVGVIRRFSRSPRLILTVATIGLSQLLAALALLLPRWWDASAASQRIDLPLSFTFTIRPLVFTADDVAVLVVAPLVLVAVAVFLRTSAVGVAIRASAERADRARLLGIPVNRLQTIVWVMATVLSFVALFLRAGIIGLPIGTALGLSVLMRALAALVIGRPTSLPGVALAAIALGVLETAVAFNVDSPLAVDPIIAAVVLVALLVRRRGVSRLEDDATSSWQAVEEVRPVAPQVASLPSVRAVRWGTSAAIALAALVLPNVVSPDLSLKASAVLVFGLVGLSIVVLTGWSGQVSLGQMAFVAIGAAVGAKLTSTWHVDLVVALVGSAIASAAAAIVVGLPALRVRGMMLAVTTLAFALATSSWLLNRRFFSWIPNTRIERPPLLGRFAWDTPTRLYYVVLAVVAVMFAMVAGVRRSRTGRVLLALRENERGAEAVGVGVVRVRLTAFALSGAIAGVAGCLFVHHQQSFDLASYVPSESLVVFTCAVIGGLGSPVGALLGAVWYRGAQWFLPPAWQFLASGTGVLLVLLALPSGLGGLVFRLRDRLYAELARRAVAPAVAPPVDRAAPTSEPDALEAVT